MASPLDNLIDFSLVSDSVTFEPTYYPERVKPSRERNIDREDNLCDGEEITDNGAKNRDIHISGFLLESEKETFWGVSDSGEEFEMIAMPWSGFVQIESVDLEGPKGVDNRERELIYKYTIKVIEASQESSTGNGIIRGNGFEQNNDFRLD